MPQVPRISAKVRFDYLWRNEIRYANVLLLPVCFDLVVFFFAPKSLVNTFAEITGVHRPYETAPPPQDQQRVLGVGLL